MNYLPANYIPDKSKIYKYDIMCYNDMGHFAFSSSDGQTFMNLPSHVSDFMFELYRKYVTSYQKEHVINGNKIVTIHYKLRPNLSNKWKYSFRHGNDVYQLHVKYDL